MKKKTYLIYMLTGALALGAMVSLTACSSSEESIIPPTGVFNYDRQVSGAGYSSQMILDDLQSDVVSATSNASWIRVKPAISTSGKPCVQLDVDAIPEGTEERQSTFEATDNQGKKAVVTVVQYSVGEGDLACGGNADDWFKNWYNFKTVKVTGTNNKGSIDVTTPWCLDPVPETVCLDNISHVTPAQGWEMAFSYLNDVSSPDRRYFALYNRYLGILRVFCYIPDGTVPSGETYFEVQYGPQNPTGSSTFYPFYNSTGYSIPTCYAGGQLNFHTDLTGLGTKTFHSLITPYTRSVSKTATVGWNVFDVNMHGYVPSTMSWRAQADGECLFINMVSRQNANIVLDGMFSGALNGTFTPPDIQQHGGGSTTDGICSVLGIANKILGGVAGGGPGEYSRNMMNWYDYKQRGADAGGPTGWNNFMMDAKTYCGYASIGVTIANAVFGAIGTQIPEWYDTIPGKINLTLNGTIKLNGTMTQWTSVNHAGLSIKKNAVVGKNGMNKGGHFGEGVISLAEDPVICVAKEDLMAASERCFLNIEGAGQYKNSDIETYALRLIYFLDPTSIKLNLNTDLFKDLGGVQSVVVTPTWGVYPDSPYGSTNAMRTVLGMENPPVISLRGTQAGGVLQLNSTDSPIRLHVVDYDDLMNTEMSVPETEANCTTVMQSGTNIRYYGHVLEYGGKTLIVQPQIHVPYKDDVAEDIMVPDIVVGINVTFHVKNANPTADKPHEAFTYQLQYVPKIKLVSRAELAHYRDLLKQCRNDWQPADLDAEKPAGTLENDKSVKFYMPFICLQKSIDMLEKVTK